VAIEGFERGGGDEAESDKKKKNGGRRKRREDTALSPQTKLVEVGTKG